MYKVYALKMSKLHTKNKFMVEYSLVQRIIVELKKMLISESEHADKH